MAKGQQGGIKKEPKRGIELGGLDFTVEPESSSKDGSAWQILMSLSAQRLLPEVGQLWQKFGQYIFDEETDYYAWLFLGNPQLGNKSPYEFSLEAGNINEIEAILGRMAYGVLA